MADSKKDEPVDQASSLEKLVEAAKREGTFVDDSNRGAGTSSSGAGESKGDEGLQRLKQLMEQERRAKAKKGGGGTGPGDGAKR